MRRPESANALSPDLIEALQSALTHTLSLPKVRAVVITGVGGVFCAGADLKVADQMLEQGATDQLSAYMESANDLMDRIEDHPLPVIARVNGAALAGGLELVLACDLAVASATAPIGDAHVGHGFVPAWGASRRLPRAVGIVAARRLMLTGSVFTAAEIPEMFTEVVPDADLDDAVENLVAEIAAASPAAICEVKKLLRPERAARPVSRRQEWTALQRQLTTGDPAEGLAAHRSGRPPAFGPVRKDRVT